MSVKDESQEHWMTKLWRPMMGWTYMATCIFDFIAGPILYNILQYHNPGQAIGMWVPLTLQGGGMYHIAMGAIIGVSAFGRTQEKLAITNAPDPAPVPPVMMQTPPAPAPSFGAPSGFAAPVAPAPSGFAAPVAMATTVAPAPSFGAPSGFAAPVAMATTASGKKIIPTDPDPEI